MEWLSAIRAAIDYMEKHLTDDISAQDVAGQVYLSPFFLQRGFSLMTGYGIGEYIRNRRLYLAALDLQRTDEKVIDIALRYCYETPESFTKAFVRFHGATPTQVRDGAAVNVFFPLTLKLSIQGGHQMEYKITPMFPFKSSDFRRCLTMKPHTLRSRSSGMRFVRNMQSACMLGTRLRILTSRRSWTIASASTAFVSTISEVENSDISSLESTWAAMFRMA